MKKINLWLAVAALAVGSVGCAPKPATPPAAAPEAAPAAAPETPPAAAPEAAGSTAK